MARIAQSYPLMQYLLKTYKVTLMMRILQPEGSAHRASRFRPRSRGTNHNISRGPVPIVCRHILVPTRMADPSPTMILQVPTAVDPVQGVSSISLINRHTVISRSRQLTLHTRLLTHIRPSWSQPRIQMRSAQSQSSWAPHTSHTSRQDAMPAVPRRPRTKHHHNTSSDMIPLWTNILQPSRVSVPL